MSEDTKNPKPQQDDKEKNVATSLADDLDPSTFGGLFSSNYILPNYITSVITPGLISSPGVTVSGLGSIGNAGAYVHILDNNLQKKQRELEAAIVDLQKQISDRAKAFQEEKHTAQELARKKADLEEKLRDLTEKQRLGFLLNCVNQDGQRALLQSQDFQQKFLSQKESSAFVISLDIRRSTELMLKARTAQAFASFITNLCLELMDIIKGSYGVIDKFTGDGVLAFYPEFYSGDDAAIYAVTAAERCHAAFRRHYDNSRESFKSILTDVGLGIGVDYGSVHLVQIAGGLTVVGEPVVYACRLSGAPAGITLLNQPAYEQIMRRFSALCFVTESGIEFKHEGRMLAYSIKLNGGKYSPVAPTWVAEIGSQIQE